MKQQNTTQHFFSPLIICAISCLLTSAIGCSDETTPTPPSNQYYVTYTWSGEGDYRITYWLQSGEQQHLSLSTGSASSQGSYTSPVINHANNLDLAIKTAIEYTSNDCANVQMALYRDSAEVLRKDYVMGNPDNQNCTGDNFRQTTYTP